MTTATGIIVATALIILWDVWLFVTGRETISLVIAKRAKRSKLFWAVLLFAIGFLAGHWLWGMCP